LSSILRALKKLDEDSVSKGKEVEPRKTGIKEVVTRRTGGPLGFHRILVWVFVFLVVGSAAWVAIAIYSNKKTPGTQTVKLSSQKPVSISKEVNRPVSAVPVDRNLPGASGGEKEREIPATGEEKQDFTGSRGESPIPSTEQSTPPGPGSSEKPQASYPNMVLNGILWSDNSNRRVVLLNDRYMKEGEVFNGVSVVKIEKNSVTLRWGKETWTLKLDKKQ